MKTTIFPIIILLLSICNLLIDLRRISYASVTLVALTIAFSTFEGIKSERYALIIFILCLLIIIMNFIMAYISRNNIDAFESKVRSKLGIIIFILCYIYIFILFMKNDSEQIVMALISSLMTALLSSLLLRELIDGYIFTWLIYFMGREEVYSNARLKFKCVKAKGNKFHSMRVNDWDNVFVPSRRIIKRYAGDEEFVSITANIRIKRLPLINRMMIKEIW